MLILFCITRQAESRDFIDTILFYDALDTADSVHHNTKVENNLIAINLSYRKCGDPYKMIIYTENRYSINQFKKYFTLHRRINKT